MQGHRKCLLAFPAAQEPAVGGDSHQQAGLPGLWGCQAGPKKPLSPAVTAQGHVLALRLRDTLVKAKIE